MTKEPREVITERGGQRIRYKTTTAADLGEPSPILETSAAAPNLNEREPWSEGDVLDLKSSLAHDDTVEEIADFLCRSIGDVRARWPR